MLRTDRDQLAGLHAALHQCIRRSRAQGTRLRLWRLSGAAPRGACAQYFSTLRTRRRLALVPYPRRQSQPVSAGRLAGRATSRSSGGTFLDPYIIFFLYVIVIYFSIVIVCHLYCMLLYVIVV